MNSQCKKSFRTEVRLLGLASVVTATSLLPRTAHAIEKMQPASACQVLDEANTAIGRGASDIGSTSGAFSISCPLLRDNTTNTNGITPFWLRVNKGDATSRTCTAYAADGYGNILKSVSKSVSGTGVQTFDWGTSFNVSSANGATYAVSCTFGALDFGENMYWNEPNPPLGADTKSLPGTSCKPSEGPYILTRSSTSLSGSSTFNQAEIECPLLRDQFNLFSGLTDLNMRVYRGGPQPSDCQGIVADNYQNYVLSVDKVMVAGNQTLKFGTSLNTWNLNAYYDIECFLLNPQDRIYEIDYAE